MTDPKTMPDSPPPSSGGAGTLLATVALLLGIGGLAVGGLALEKLSRADTAPQVALQPSPLPSRAISVLNARLDRQVQEQQAHIDALKAEIAGLHETLATQREAPAADTAVTQQVTESLVHHAEAQAQLVARLDAIDAALADIRKTAPSFDDADVRSLRYVQLRESLLEGKEYSLALERFRESLGDGIAEKPEVRAAITTLSKNTRIPALATLYRDFDAIPTHIRKVEDTYQPETPPEEGWWKRSAASLSTLVTVERITKESSPHALVMDARTALARGDITLAAERIGQLPESDRSVYESWLSAVATYDSALAALAILREAALTEELTPPDSDSTKE